MKVVVCTKNQNSNKVLGRCLTRVDTNTWAGDLPERVLRKLKEDLKDCVFVTWKKETGTLEIK